MKLFDLISSDEKKLLQKSNVPEFIQPMLAKLTDKPFSNQNWIFERKLDGERCLVFKKGKIITLKSRNDKVLNHSYPEIIDALTQLELPNCIIDGEIVSFDKKSTSFSLLQKRFGVDFRLKKDVVQVPVYYYAFDILYYDKYFVLKLPLLTRKLILEKLIPFNDVFRYSEHIFEKGESYFKSACKNKWEGLIAKKKNSKYITARSSDWLKIKCVNEQEFVIGGYSSPGGARSSFGALLLGYYENGKLHYAGKVGTGYDEETLRELGKKLQSLETNNNPFINFDISSEGIHWVKPVLVCQIQFTEWTGSNKLRHASFLGLRRDKKARDVSREQ